MRTFRRIRRTLAAVLLVTCPAACSGWHTVPIGPRAFVDERQPDLIRVTTASDQQLVVSSPQVAGDTLKGITTRPGAYTGPLTERAEAVWPVAIALADVTKVEVRQVSPGRVLLVALGVSATLMAVGVIVCYTGDGCGPHWEGVSF